ncbi:MAG: hypothetical protein JRC90_01860 [Deltaproteobacteria bacterium]|nr:hypothetical protein [Deltaproteobacteria bacterium]
MVPSGREIKLNWQKRIHATQLDDEIDFLSKNGGIYIWIFNGTPPRITYVGETECYIDRFVQHFSNILTGRFNTYAMTPEDDFVNYLNEYCHDKSFDEIDKNKFYIPGKPSPDFRFKNTYFEENLLKMHRNYLENLDFAFAKGNFKDKNERREMEGILIKGLIELYSKEANVEVLESKIPRSRQIPIGRISKNPSQSYEIEHQHDPLKIQLPEDIINIRGYDFESKRIRWANEKG